MTLKVLLILLFIFAWISNEFLNVFLTYQLNLIVLGEKSEDCSKKTIIV